MPKRWTAASTRRLQSASFPVCAATGVRGVADRLGHGRDPVDLSRGDDDLRPCARELAGDGLADAAAGARDDRDLAVHRERGRYRRACGDAHAPRVSTGRSKGGSGDCRTRVSSDLGPSLRREGGSSFAGHACPPISDASSVRDLADPRAPGLQARVPSLRDRVGPRERGPAGGESGRGIGRVRAGARVERLVRAGARLFGVASDPLGTAALRFADVARPLDGPAVLGAEVGRRGLPGGGAVARPVAAAADGARGGGGGAALASTRGPTSGVNAEHAGAAQRVPKRSSESPSLRMRIRGT